MNTITDPTTAVVAKVGPDRTGCAVIAAHNPIRDINGHRVFIGNVAADYRDRDRIARIVAVSAGCDLADVEILSALDADTVDVTVTVTMRVPFGADLTALENRIARFVEDDAAVTELGTVDAERTR